MARLTTGMRRSALALGLGVWLVPASPRAAPAAEDDQASALAVSTGDSLPQGDAVRGWVEERGQQVLAEREQPLGPEQRIRITIDGSPFDYRIEMEAVSGAQPLADQPQVLTCECGSDEMLERVGEAIVRAAQELEAAARAEREAAAERARAEAEESSPVAPVMEEDHPRRLGPMGYAGIGVGVLGAGAIAAGIPLALRPPDDIRGEPGQIELRSTRPVGIGLAIGGGVALAGGVALLVVDLVRHREQRVAVVPVMGPGAAGISLRVGF